MNTLNYIWSQNSRADIRKIYDENNIEYRLCDIERHNFPKRLFKYCSVNEYSLNNLRENEITMTCPTEFNDIFDSTMHVNYTNRTKKEIAKLNTLGKQLGYGDLYATEMIENAQKHYEKKSHHMLDYLLDGFYINSFTTDYHSILMWSHYADNNKGICIEYDFNAADVKVQNSIFKTTYIDKPIDVTDLIESKDNNKISLSVLISIVSKFKDWEYENEWRIVYYLGTNPNNKKNYRFPIINIPIPKRIYLGNKFYKMYHDEKKDRSKKYNQIEELLTLIEKRNIPVKMAKRQSNSFKLEFIDLTVNELRNSRYQSMKI